jgi:hypothetical protein
MPWTKSFSADCDRSRWRRRENICAYIFRRSEVSDLSVKKKYRRRPPVLPGSDFLSRSCDQGKAARSSPRHRISRPLLKLNFASANPLKFQRRNSARTSLWSTPAGRRRVGSRTERSEEEVVCQLISRQTVVFPTVCVLWAIRPSPPPPLF